MLPFQPFNQRLANNWPNAGFQGKLARRHETYCPCSSLVFFASLPSNKHKTWYKPSVEAILSLTCVRSTVPDVLYSGFVPRARVFNLCHEYYLQRAEYIWQKNDLSSLVSLYRSNFQSGVVTHTPKMNTPVSMWGTHSYLQKERNMHYQKPAFIRHKNVAKPFIEVFSTSHENLCMYCHGKSMSRSNNDQRLQRSNVQAPSSFVISDTRPRTEP